MLHLVKTPLAQPASLVPAGLLLICIAGGFNAGRSPKLFSDKKWGPPVRENQSVPWNRSASLTRSAHAKWGFPAKRGYSAKWDHAAKRGFFAKWDHAAKRGFFAKWGFFAHKKINRTAVFTLPAPMLRFYKSKLDYLTERAVSADKRRYILEEEAARHYFDTEYYGRDFLNGELPGWKEMQERFPGASFRENGILPWNILRVTRLLTRAFQDRDSIRILRYSADLGHYLADAHVPLHTTRNYNGQLTGQTGIHAFWESRIPELFSNQYDYLTGKARYIPDLRKKIWGIIRESHRAVDSVLSIEKTLSKTFPSDRKYTIYLKNNRTVKNYSRDYSARYQDRLHGMIERRLTGAILVVGSFWYTAWVNAGQPPLEGLEHHPLSAAEQDLLKKQNRDQSGRQILGRGE